MGRIQLNSQVDAPDGCYEIIDQEDGRSILVQTDIDLPGLAQTFGWSLTAAQTPENRDKGVDCEHRQTDGTIPCPNCHLMPLSFIDAARDFLDAHDGEEADDPGYFTEDTTWMQSGNIVCVNISGQMEFARLSTVYRDKAGKTLYLTCITESGALFGGPPRDGKLVVNGLTLKFSRAGTFVPGYARACDHFAGMD